MMIFLFWLAEAGVLKLELVIVNIGLWSGRNKGIGGVGTGSKRIRQLYINSEKSFTQSHDVCTDLVFVANQNKIQCMT